MTDLALALKVSADTRNALQAFKELTAKTRGLEKDAQEATNAVAKTAAALKADPGNKTLAKELENLKRQAAGVKKEYVDSRNASGILKNALAEQRREVGNLAQAYTQLARAEQTSNQSSTRKNSQLPSVQSAKSTINPASVNTAVSSIDQLNRGLSRTEGLLVGVVDQFKTMGRIAVGLVIGNGLIDAGRKVADLSDEYTKYTSQIRLAVDQTGSFTQAIDDVTRIYGEATTSLGAVGNLYSKITNSTKELNISQGEVAKITETVALSLKVSGATAQESASSILQLGQAFASGLLRGDEFNSVAETSPRLMKALADSIGVPIGALRQMAEQGQLTSKLLATALPAALQGLQGEAEKMPLTFGPAFTSVGNSAITLVGKFNDSTGALSGMANAIKAFGDNLGAVIGVALTLVGAYTAKKIQSTLQIRAAEKVANAARLAEIASEAQAARAAQLATLSGFARMDAAARTMAATTTTSAATAVTAMGRVGLALRGVLGFITGPVGLVVSIGLAATAFFNFSNSATDALDAVIKKQKELNRLKGEAEKTGVNAYTDAAALKNLEQAKLAVQEAARQHDELAQTPVYQFKSFAAPTDQQANALKQQQLDQIVEKERLAAQALMEAQRQVTESAKTEADRQKNIAAQLAQAKQIKGQQQLDYEKSLTDAQYSYQANAAARSLETLQQQYQLKKISAQQYFAEKTRLETASADAEIKRTTEELTRTQQLARTATDQTTALKARGEAATIAAKLSAELAAKDQIAAKNSTALALATQKASSAIKAQTVDLDALLAKYDDSFAVIKQYQDAQADLSTLYKAGRISLDEWTDALNRMLDAAEGMDQITDKTTKVGKAIKEQKPAIDAYGELWKNALKRVDDAFVDLWKGAFSSFSDFRSSLTNAFKEMLAQLANAAITRPIVIGITTAMFGSGSSAATAAGQLMGGAGSSGSLGSFGSVGDIAQNLFGGAVGYGLNYGASLLGGAGAQQAGMLASQTGSFGAYGANATYNSLTGSSASWGGSGASGAGAATLGLGAGAMLGGYLGGKYAGPVGAGIGTAVGGVGGVALTGAATGALAGTGAAAGASAALAAVPVYGWIALAALALYSALSGKRPQDHSSSGTFDFATGIQQNTGGDRPNAESDKARDAISAVFSGVNSILDSAGLKSSSAIAYDQSMKYGFRGGIDGQAFNYRDTEKGLKELIQKVVMSATGDVPAWVKQVLANVNGSIESTLNQMQSVANISGLLNNDPVANARADYATATATPKSAVEIYNEQATALQTMASQFQYSEQNIAQLSQAMAQNQQTAYALTLSYLQAADAIKGSIGALKDQISQSLMSDKELYDYRKAQADSLAASLRGMTDPTKITQTVAQIEQLTQTAWQSLADEQKKAMGGDFLKFLDDTNALAQSQINKGLKDVKDTQASLADQVNTVMAKVGADMQAAADKQAAAASAMQDAVGRFQAAVNRLGGDQPIGGEVIYA